MWASHDSPPESWAGTRAIYLEEAEAAVLVMLGREEQPCPTCEGDPNFDPLTEAGNLSDLKCPSCGGSGVIPGREPLRTPCDTCGGTGFKDGWPSDPNQAAVSKPLTAGGGLPLVQHRCPDCSDGFGLPAIDVARGLEQVGWLSDWSYKNMRYERWTEGAPKFNALWEVGAKSGAEPVYRFTTGQ